MHQIRNKLLKVHDLLQTALPLEKGWPGGKWPVSGEFSPPEFEIIVGAVLTQNTRWENVEKILLRLLKAKLQSVDLMVECPIPILEEVLRPVGFFRKKAGVLKRLAKAILEYPGDFYSQVQRSEILCIGGVGPETADAILLYACARLEFVADAYARRILHRYGLIEGTSYRDAKEIIESHLPLQVGLYQRFHALLVEHGKTSCRRVPLCPKCVLRESCRWVRRSTDTH